MESDSMEESRNKGNKRLRQSSRTRALEEAARAEPRTGGNPRTEHWWASGQAQKAVNRTIEHWRTRTGVRTSYRAAWRRSILCLSLSLALSFSLYLSVSLCLSLGYIYTASHLSPLGTSPTFEGLCVNEHLPHRYQLDAVRITRRRNRCEDTNAHHAYTQQPIPAYVRYGAIPQE